MSERLQKIEKNLSDMLDMEAKNVADEKKEVEERVDVRRRRREKERVKLESGIKRYW